MRISGFKTVLAIGFAGIALAAGSWKSAEGGQPVTLLNVSYDPTRELYEAINDAFAADYLKKASTKVTIEQSHGGSGKQAASVVNGLQADVVTLGVAWDIDAIRKAGLVKPGWQDRFRYNSAPYTSTVAFLVRKGNPKHIHDWRDLLRPGVQIIAPNPKVSGAGRWAFLGLWGATAGAKTYDLSTKEGLAASIADGKTAKDFPAYKNAAALAAITEFYKHVPVLDTGARGATVTFAQKGIGDVLLNWENELYLASDEFGKDKFEIIYPTVSVLGEPPVAVVDTVVDKKGTRAVATAYLQYLYSPEAQDIIAQWHYRPRDVEVYKKYSSTFPPVKLFTVDQTFGGWPRAQKTFFADGGVFDQIYKPTK
ncbi:MAG: sulfate ABC transporter substrate-binding protein [Methylovirgula sp.]|nr:sulfate ABC transporter substrate-binding protein [Methylovirgula sp.]